MTLTPEHLAEWRDLLQATSPGEWYVEPGGAGYLTAKTPCEACGEWHETTLGQLDETANAEFTVAVRTALPALLAEVERLQAVEQAALVYRQAARAVYQVDWDDEAQQLRLSMAHQKAMRVLDALLAKGKRA